MAIKSMLVDSFEYGEYKGKDRSHNASYEQFKAINNVRIDRTRQFHRDTDEAIVRAEATIYCYSKYTNPFLNFKEQSKVIIDGEEYTIKTKRSYIAPFKKDMAVFELDVI